jgi:hypothetical protein
MTSILAKVSTLAAISFAVCSILAHLLGQLQPPNPALAGFTQGCEGKPQPCWFGIVPGRTTVIEAQRALAAIPYTYESLDTFGHENETWTLVYGSSTLRCSVQILHSGTRIGMITITNCEDVRVGDLVTVLGRPNSIRALNLIFHDETIRARSQYRDARDNSCLDLSPYGAVESIQVRQQTSNNAYLQPARWSGFQSYEWYVKREGAMPCTVLSSLS